MCTSWEKGGGEGGKREEEASQRGGGEEGIAGPTQIPPPSAVRSRPPRLPPPLPAPPPHRVGDGFPLLRVEASNGLGVGAVDHSQRVGRERHRGRVEQLAAQPRELGVAYLPPLVGVEREAGKRVDQQEVLGGRDQQRHRVLGVEVRRLHDGGLAGGVDAHLRGGGHHQVAVPESHLHHAVALAEVDVLLDAAHQVGHHNLARLTQPGREALPLQRAAQQLAENNGTGAAGARELHAVGRPGEGEDGAGHGRGRRVGPPRRVTQPQRVEGAHSEKLAVGRPRDGRDGVLARGRREEKAAQRVPHLAGEGGGSKSEKGGRVRKEGYKSAIGQSSRKRRAPGPHLVEHVGSQRVGGVICQKKAPPPKEGPPTPK